VVVVVLLVLVLVLLRGAYLAGATSWPACGRLVLRHGIRKARRGHQMQCSDAADQQRGRATAFLPLAMQEAPPQADIEGGRLAIFDNVRGSSCCDEKESWCGGESRRASLRQKRFGQNFVNPAIFSKAAPYLQWGMDAEIGVPHTKSSGVHEV